MRHPDDGLIEEFLDGELAPARAAELEAHVGGCQACRERLGMASAAAREARALVEALGEPSPGATAPATRVRSRPSPWRPLAWAATVVMAAGLGYAGGSWRPPSPPTTGEGPGIVAPPAATREADAEPGALQSGGPGAPEQSAADPVAERRARSEVAEAEAPPRAPGVGAVGQAGREEVAAATPAPAEAEEFAKARSDAAALEAPRNALRQAAPVVADEATGPDYAPAIAVLGGSIRLIDGMEARAVRVLAQGPGPDSAPAVEVLYPGGVRLLQWRLEAGVDRLVQVEAGTARWSSGDGFGFELAAPGDDTTLRALAARVR